MTVDTARRVEVWHHVDEGTQLVGIGLTDVGAREVARQLQRHLPLAYADRLRRALGEVQLDVTHVEAAEVADELTADVVAADAAETRRYLRDSLARAFG